MDGGNSHQFQSNILPFTSKKIKCYNQHTHFKVCQRFHPCPIWILLSYPVTCFCSNSQQYGQVDEVSMGSSLMFVAGIILPPCSAASCQTNETLVIWPRVLETISTSPWGLRTASHLSSALTFTDGCLDHTGQRKLTHRNAYFSGELDILHRNYQSSSQIEHEERTPQQQPPFPLSRTLFTTPLLTQKGVYWINWTLHLNQSQRKQLQYVSYYLDREWQPSAASN